MGEKGLGYMLTRGVTRRPEDTDLGIPESVNGPVTASTVRSPSEAAGVGWGGQAGPVVMVSKGLLRLACVGCLA